MVTGLVEMHLDLTRKWSGVVMGSGRFVGPKTIELPLPMASYAFFTEAGRHQHGNPRDHRSNSGLAEAIP